MSFDLFALTKIFDLLDAIWDYAYNNYEVCRAWIPVRQQNKRREGTFL